MPSCHKQNMQGMDGHVYTCREAELRGTPSYVLPAAAPCLTSPAIIVTFKIHFDPGCLFPAGRYSEPEDDQARACGGSHILPVCLQRDGLHPDETGLPQSRLPHRQHRPGITTSCHLRKPLPVLPQRMMRCLGMMREHYL